MSTDYSLAAPRNPADNQSAPWLIALAGYAVMYAPVYWWATTTIWQSEEHGHGPLILAVLISFTVLKFYPINIQYRQATVINSD